MANRLPYDEKDLLARLKTGEHLAFDAIYYRFEPRLRLFLMPFTGSDKAMLEMILQDVFVKLWMKREELDIIHRLEFYLQRMARNHLLDLLKLRNIRERHEALHAALQQQDGAITERHLQLKEYMSVACEAIALLPERRRIIFTLNTLEGFSIDEVAQQLGLSRDVIKKQLTASKAFVKDYISRKSMIRFGVLLPLIP